MGLAAQEEGGATRMVVRRERIRELMEAKGIKNVEELTAAARAKGVTLSLSTVYSVLGNQNFQRETIDKLALVLECDVLDILTSVKAPKEGE
jgi:Fe2+ or Zn2+ uptake regulation protein